MSRIEEVITETEHRFAGRAVERTQAEQAIREARRPGGSLLDVDEPALVRQRVRRIIDGGLGKQPGPGDGEDPGLIERIIGGHNLLAVAFLELGLDAARTVARVHVRDRTGTRSLGTGFMVSPALLLTNNHVLQDAGEAAPSRVEFNYQDGTDGLPRRSHVFALEPERLFLTDKDLDFTLVAVADLSLGAEPVPLADFGFNRTTADQGKILLGEFINIVQHPGGRPKQLALQENEVVDRLKDFLHYRTDTAPGSSGSPLFNNQWEVVGIHHSGVPRRDADGRILTVDGTVWTPDQPDSRIDWLANEGVRISSILGWLAAAASGLGAAQQALLAEVLHPPGEAAPTVPAEEAVSIDPDYGTRRGYDPAFLGERVPLPGLSAAQRAYAALNRQAAPEADPAVLDYHHFSLVVDGRRRLALYTAVNVDGASRRDLRRERDAWIFDPRIGREHQAGNDLYANNDLDRGHLVRRLDPAWGPDDPVAKAANDDTFHFTNCSPQHKSFNQGGELWAGLEDFLLDGATADRRRITVFTGPVLEPGDPVYRGVAVPAQFWKVAVFDKPGGEPAAAAFLVSQRGFLDGLLTEAFQPEMFQVPVRRIAELTGLGLSHLFAWDRLDPGGIPYGEEKFQHRRVGSYDDILL